MEVSGFRNRRRGQRRPSEIPGDETDDETEAPFGRDFTVVRGGLMEDHFFMWQNATDELQETGRWGISVGCAQLERDQLADLTLNGKSYCASDVGTIRDAGFEVEPDDAPHALLMLGSPPAEVPADWTVEADLWTTVRSLFHGPYPRPGYPGRRP